MFDTTRRFGPTKLSIPNTPEKKTGVDRDKSRSKPKRGRWKLPASAQAAKHDIFELVVFMLFLILGIVGVALCFDAMMTIS
jgi:hypothetical protein